MGIVVEEILLQFVLELSHRLEGCSLQEVLVQGSPEPLDLPVGLGPIGSGVTVLDAQFLSIRSMGWPSMFLGEAISGPLSVRIASNWMRYSALRKLILFRAANMTDRLLMSETTSAQAIRVQASMRATR